MKRVLWLAGLMVVLAGCSSGVGSGSAHQGNAASPASAQPEAKLASATRDRQPAVTQRAAVQTAEMTVRVKDLNQAERTVTRLVLESGGFISSSESGDLNAASPTIQLNLRIPVAKFAGLMTQFENLGDRLHRKSKAEDVTGALIDFDARLKNMRAEEDSVRESLRKTTAGTYQLEVQHKLSVLRGEIESIEGQRHALGELASLSTVDLTLVGAAAGMAATDQGWMRETWNESTAMLGHVVQVLGSIAVFFAVMSPIWLPITGLIVWLARRQRAQAKAQPE